MKKNISYCLYGSNPKYIVGAEKNIKINKELLPDWKTCIYYSSNEYDDKLVSGLSDLGAEMIDVKKLEITKYVNYQMFWRYFIFEKNELSIVRDLDSRITPREVLYIKKWIDSDKNYFVIRDHPWQSEIPGGLFGLKNPQNFWNFFKEFVKSNNLDWGIDQQMLKTYMDNINRDSVSYFSFEDKKHYIPRDNVNFFIGIQLDERDEVVSPNSTLALKYLSDLKL